MSQLFATFEVNRVPRWPLMSRLVALSVVLHGVFLVAIIYVPALRGMLQLASSMSGIEFVREDYDKSLLGQRATIIQLGPHEKLYYPPDYFGSPEVAETTQFDPMMIQPAAPPPVPVYRPRRARTPRPAPQPTPGAEEVAEATPTPEASPTPVTDEARQAAEAEMEEVERKTGVKRLSINPKPWEDLAADGKQLFDAGKLKLDSAVDVSARAERDVDGKLKPGSVKITWNTPAADQTTQDMARKVITAVSESKMLGTLEGAKGVDMTLKLDEKEVSIVIANEFPSAAEAEKFASGYGMLLFGARIARSGKEDGELYKNVKVSQDGSRFVITFKMPKDAAGKMIADILSKKAAKPAAAAQTKG
ncbi:MAG TPA: hypothetical protein VGB98_07925 [Pyrinomonadaceae bacterium]|jgi:hypothetical protein